MSSILKSYLAFLLKSVSFLRHNFLGPRKSHYLSNSSETIVIFVTPWELSYIPLFSFKLGLCLLNHVNIQFLLGDIPVGPNKVSHRFICYILRALAFFSPLKVHLLSKIPPSKLDIENPIYAKLAYMNAIHYLKYEHDDQRFKEIENVFLCDLKKSATHLKSFFENYHFSRVIIPGGICQDTGLFFHFAGERKIITFDSGIDDVFQIAINGIAAYQSDISLIFREFKLQNEDHEFAKNKALEEIDKRFVGKSLFSYQPNQRTQLPKRERIRVLIPLNVCWDSAALGNFIYFRDSIEWLYFTIKLLLEKVSDCEVIVRRHPVERWEFGRSLNNYPELISDFITNPRFRFIDYEENYNTYDILKETDLVICQSTTIGIEAACNGTRVICVSDCYFTQLGFVDTPKTIEEYSEMLIEATHIDYKISPAALDNAYDSYYLSQCCNWYITDFHPGLNFDYWNSETPSKLLKNKDFPFIVEGILNDIPPAIYKHKKLIEV